LSVKLAVKVRSRESFVPDVSLYDRVDDPDVFMWYGMLDAGRAEPEE
jgi:hypothetical protein